jgi:ubiquinol-cytochrome c reductase cytochrome b subunit
MCLVLQIATRIFLAMNYTAHVDLSFNIVQHIMRDVPNGWLLRYLHANRASLFFIVVYLHIFRGLYYTSYAQPRELVWLLRIVILLLMVITAFLRYILPWRQMSLWRATVITSLAGAIPLVRNSIVGWLWGGFAVDNPTLNRFYSLHYLLPFVLAALSLAHLAALHQYGSTNPLRINAQTDLVDFYPYFYVKDFAATLGMAFFAVWLVGFHPEALGHPDNNIPANPYSTPAHIVPEWYFLWVYAMLRSIPNKLRRVAVVGLVFVTLAALPYMHKPQVRSPSFRSLHERLVWAFIRDFILLTWLGSMPVEAPYYALGQLSTILFFFILTLICLAAWADRWLAGSFDKKISRFSYIQ